MTMSLETKLVVSSIALLAVVSAVIATATTLLFNDFLTDRLDLQVSSAARRSTSAAVQPPPEAREVSFLLFPGQAVDTFGARVRDGVVRRAAVLTGVGTVRQVQAPPELARVTGRPVTVSLGPLGDYRMVGVRAPDGDLLVTGLPVLGVQTTLTRLVVVEAPVTLAGVAVVAVAATLLVRRAVRPLGRLAATAARVSELPLATGEAVRLARVPEVDTDPRTEIGQVGGALNRMLGHVETAFAVRHESETRLRRFIADASHELRTPLASIVGYAELTRRGGEPHGPQTTHALGRIRSEAGRMTTLVEDLLLLARLDAGRPLERAELDLSPIVVNAVSDAYAAAPGHRWLVSLPDQPVLVVGDADRLHQVVTNLLANARTHTPPGTTVTHDRAAGGDRPGGRRRAGHSRACAAARVRQVRARRRIAVPAGRGQRARPGHRLGRRGGARRAGGGGQRAGEHGLHAQPPLTRPGPAGRRRPTRCPRARRRPA